MSKLSEFLNKNSIKSCPELPLMHTTDASNIESIVDANALSATDCNVFLDEKLLYFFYGKPAYKKHGQFQQSEYWQYPICFLINSKSISNPKRIFPFDSGAFISKRHPQYINIFNLNEYEADVSMTSANKIIGAFFDSVDDFYQMKVKEESSFKSEHGLGVLDHHVLALRKLAGDSSLESIDDRRFAVEVQYDDDLLLEEGVVDAVILPSSYAENDKVRNFITQNIKAEIIIYPLLGLNASGLSALIYDRVYTYLQHKGVMDV